jgi:hypothetical protein
MSYAAQHRNNRARPFDPNDWANKKRAAVERAKQLRNDRSNGDAECTFVPK